MAMIRRLERIWKIRRARIAHGARGDRGAGWPRPRGAPLEELQGVRRERNFSPSDVHSTRSAVRRGIAWTPHASSFSTAVLTAARTRLVCMRPKSCGEAARTFMSAGKRSCPDIICVICYSVMSRSRHYVDDIICVICYSVINSCGGRRCSVTPSLQLWPPESLYSEGLGNRGCKLLPKSPRAQERGLKLLFTL